MGRMNGGGYAKFWGEVPANFYGTFLCPFFRFLSQRDNGLQPWVARNELPSYPGKTSSSNHPTSMRLRRFRMHHMSNPMPPTFNGAHSRCFETEPRYAWSD